MYIITKTYSYCCVSRNSQILHFKHFTHLNRLIPLIHRFLISMNYSFWQQSLSISLRNLISLSYIIQHSCHHQVQSDAIYLVILLNFIHHCRILTSLRQNIFKYFYTAQKQSNIFKHFISLKIANLVYHTY